jgi:hypothetical protein
MTDWRAQRLAIAEELPAAVPRIIDGQRKRVFAAEDRLPARRLAPAAVASVLEAEDVVADGNGKTRYHHGLIRLEPRPKALHVLHAIAHSRVDPVFPEHGAEWCAEMLKLMNRHLGGQEMLRLRKEYGRRRIRWDPANNDLALRRCRGIARNHPGSVVRIVQDDPPEETIAILLGWADGGALAYTANGDALLEPSRLRYISQHVHVPEAVALMGGAESFSSGPSAP